MKRIRRKALPIFYMFVITIAICLFGGSEAVSAAALKLMTVPATPNDTSQPHYTYNGHLTTFKAILQGANPTTPYYYRWDINGDGIGDQMEGKAFTNAAGGAAGGWYLGYGNDLSGKLYLPNITEERKQIITVIEVATSINAFGQPEYSNSQFGSYPILQYRDLSPVNPNVLNDNQRSILKNIAIEEALWYLHQQFVRVEASGVGATGYISNKAMNESNDVKVANTALFVLAMAESGHYGAFPAGSDLFETSDLNARNDALYNADPYAEDISRAINYLLNNLAEMTISNELDISADGVSRIDGGVDYSGLYIPNNTVPEINSSSLTLAALARSGFTGSTVAASSSLVNGLAFELIVQRMVDAGIAAQIDESNAITQGGWTYYPVNDSQVVTAVGINPLISGGWIYALHTAEKEMGASGVYINNHLKNRLANHIVYTQNTDGGCKYEAIGTGSVFSPVGNYLLACKWLGWDKWEASDETEAGYTSTTITRGQARQVYDKYLQYVIDNWGTPSDTSNPYGGYFWASGNSNSADFQACFLGTTTSNLVAKSLYGIRNFAEYDESPLVSFGSNDWKKQFSVSLIKGQHSSGYYREENNSLDWDNLGLPGTTAYAAMAGGDLYPEAISEVSITTVSLTEATTGLEYSHNLIATGGLQENYVWHISGLPAGLTYDSNTGEISGTPTLAGNYTLNVSVSDSFSTDSAVLNLSVQVGELKISTNSLLDSIAGESNSYNLAAIGGVAPYTWQATNLPLGLSLDATIGVISGIPIETGEFSINITVTDSASANAQKTLFLRINAYKPLMIATTQLPIAYVSSHYSIILKADGGKALYSWSGSGLPDGLTLNASTEEISGTPLSEGTYPVSVTVVDSVGTTAQVNLSLIVRQVNITTAELPPVYYGGTDQPYTATMTVAGGQEPYTWSYTAYLQGSSESTSLPDGLDFDPVTGVLHGSIRVGVQPQPCEIKIKATDAEGKFDEKQYALGCYPDFAHIITQSIPNGFIGQEYTAQFAAGNAYDDTSFVWSAEGMPNGFTINETTGIISGTTAVAGEHRIRVTVHLPGDSRTFSHMLFFYILEPLNIDTPSLPQGTVNTEYCYSLESHGGMLPYPFHDECTWTASGLPSGLNINESTGVIYGVPSEDGTFAVTIGLLDSEGNYASKQLDLIIADAIATDACFIATAAYGSIYQHPVVLLRQFRDRFLLTNSWGQAFVNFYYHNSPPIAQFIADSEFLKRLTRAVLSPAILAVFIIFHPVWGLFLLSLFICIAYLWRIRQKKCLHY